MNKVASSFDELDRPDLARDSRIVAESLARREAEGSRQPGTDPLSERVGDIFDRYEAGDFDQTTGPAYERAGVDPEINRASAIEAVLALTQEQLCAFAEALTADVDDDLPTIANTISVAKVARCFNDAVQGLKQ